MKSRERNGFGGAGFSLWVLSLAGTNPHRLKPAPPHPEPELSLCPLGVRHLCYIFCWLKKGPPRITGEENG